jgi:hypothetical protein
MPENTKEKKRRVEDMQDSEAPEPHSPTPTTTKKKTVIFVDWDDTLLCSSYLSGLGLRLDSEIHQSDSLLDELKLLEQCVTQLLKIAQTFGDVHVVTNAETGWVQLSAKKFIPGVLPLLSGVTVLSARSTYEPMFPDSPLKWKYFAFQDKLVGHFSHEAQDIFKNNITFGDSHVEREAVRAVTRGFSNINTKSVKFAEKPSMEQLRRQIELITNCFQYIHSHDGDLDLQLTITEASSPLSQEATTPTESGRRAVAGTSPSPVPYYDEDDDAVMA